METTFAEEAAEARRILDTMIGHGLQGFLAVAQEAQARPGDRQLAALLVRTVVDLDRLLRLRASLAAAA